MAEKASDQPRGLPKTPKKRTKAVASDSKAREGVAGDGENQQKNDQVVRRPRKKRLPRQDDEGGQDNPNFNLNNSTPDLTNSRKPSHNSRKLPPLGGSRPGTSDGAQTHSRSINKPEQTDDADGATTSIPKARKKSNRKKKRVMNEHTGMIESLGINLNDIQEDIVDPDTDQESEQETKTQQHQHMMKSQPIGKLFVEQTNGFKSADKKTLEDMYLDDKSKANEEDENLYPTTMTSLAFALSSVNIFKTFSHFCMGILAGISIWQTLYIFMLTPNGDFVSYLDVYRSSSMPINSAFYIVLIIVTVATFDRYDIAKPNRRFIVRACGLQSGAVACVLYLTALCVNVSMTPYDDRLGRLINGTSDTSREFASDEERNRHVLTWRALSVVRTVLVSLAWFTVSLRPGTHRLTKNLRNTEVMWADADNTEPAPKEQTTVFKV